MIYRKSKLLILVLCFQLPFVSMGRMNSKGNSACVQGETKKMESISGSALTIINQALPAFKKTNLNIKHYEIHIMEEGETFVVSFLDPKRPSGIRGSSPNMLEYVVVINKATLLVEKSYYLR